MEIPEEAINRNGIDTDDPWASDDIWLPENDHIRQAATRESINSYQSAMLALHALGQNTSLDDEARELLQTAIEHGNSSFEIYRKQREAYYRYYLGRPGHAYAANVISESAREYLASTIALAPAEAGDADQQADPWEDGSIWERKNIPERNARVAKFMSDQQATILALVAAMNADKDCHECQQRLLETALSSSQEAMREYLFQQSSFRKRQEGFVSTQHRRSNSARCLPYIESGACCLIKTGVCPFETAADMDASC